MNLQEAKKWLEQMGPEKAAVIVHEHYHLRQHLCSQVLQVPTGAADWVKRSIKRAEHLKEHEIQLRILLDKAQAAITETKWRIRDGECSNCQGTGRVDDQQCCICRGTGARGI